MNEQVKAFHALIDAIAAAIGGAVVPNNAETVERYDGHNSIEVDGVLIHIRDLGQSHLKSTSLQISIAPPRQFGHVPAPYGPAFTLPSGKVSSSKTPAQIALEIRRRFILPAKTGLDAWAAHIARYGDHCALARTNAQAIVAAIPGARITHTHGRDADLTQPSRESEFSLSNTQGPYLSGRISAHGVTIDRIGQMSVEQTIKILQILIESE